MKLFTGTAPKDGILLAKCDGWGLYDRGLAANGWRALKLVATAPRPRKANYWFGWHSGIKEFGRVRDILLLQSHEPSVHDWVRTVLRRLG